MAIILWMVFLAGGLFFFRRRFDVITLAFLSCCVYFIPAALPAYPVEAGAYLVYFAVFLFLVLAAAMFDRRKHQKDPVLPDPARLKVYYRGLMLIYVPTIIAFVTLSSDVAVTTKDEGGGGGLLYYFLSAILGYLFVASLALRKRVGLVVVLVNYAWFIFTGDRTQFVIAVLAVVIFFTAYHPISIKAAFGRLKPYQLLLGLALVFVGLFGKNLYGAYFDWQTGHAFGEALADRFEDMASSPAKQFEPYHVQSILDMAIESNDRISSDYLMWIPVQFLPFAGDLGSNVHDQSELVKQLYFSSWSDKSGVSSNFFAEGFLLWGYFGALLFAGLYVGMLSMFATVISRGGLVTRLGASFGAVFWAFYIHRSSLLQIISHEKRIIYSILLVVLVSRLLHTFAKASAGRTQPVSRR
jgi:hypothetical protein